MMATTTQTSTVARHPFFDFNDAADLILPRHDKDEIRTRLLDQLESMLLYLFPHGKRRGSQFYIGNLQGEPGDSLVVELGGPKRGVWIDFATGESGDVLALWASTRGYYLPADFSDLLEDAGDWLMVPRIAAAPVLHTSHAYDDLGPHTGKWDYLAADGSLLACVYRHDTPSGKQYRPWDVRTRAMRMPEPRPLYNLPAIAAADAVVLVKGEKCADVLMQLGIVATTAMGGAATVIDKTDWTPLAGKTVAVWPDHDEAGARYAAAAVQKLASIGATVRRVSVPQDKPAKWDAADAAAEGFDVETLLRASQPVTHIATAAPALDITRWRAADRFTGQPRQRRWLVEGVFPQAQAALIAAAGGVGKSFLLLALTREVAAFDGLWANAPTLFGGALAGHGVAIYITAEDDAIEVHNRLNTLGPIPDRLYVLPLPDAGGAVPLFAPDPTTRGPAITAAWVDLDRQLKAMPGLRLVVLDPLQPLCALDLNVPENAQFVCSRLAALAASTGASVIVSHHFAKREASTPEQAREAIRGTGGLVDGVRAVYALWHPKEDRARKLCEDLGDPFERGRVVLGGVVKANGRHDWRGIAGMGANGGGGMKPKVQLLGAAIARERRDGGQVKLSTFIPLKIRKRGNSKVVVRPDAQVDAPGKVATQIDKPLLVALTRAFYRQQLLDDGMIGSGSEIAQREGLHHSTVNELLRLTLLEPAIIQSILSGQQPRCMSLLWFQRNPLPTDWVAQRDVVTAFDA